MNQKINRSRKDNKNIAEEPSQKSIQRMLAFAGLLAAIERKDAKDEMRARRRLHELGVQVWYVEMQTEANR